MGQYSQSDGGLLDRISTNIGGNTSGLCEILSIDPSTEEFIKTVSVQYDTRAI